ncbi:MAG TPA: membrane protein insertase YidC [Albitalea sp.]|uniref:membrane protein insertase YidC n=1 Tax=Piscinibacter sp. TaxID=1903157 RepID=UPI002ED42300
MTDMRRTLLWGVFLVSLFLLYDAWMKHTGHPSMFAPAPPKPAAVGSAAPSSAPSAAALPTPAAAGSTAAAAAPVAAAPASAPSAAEHIVLTTDRVKATFSTLGGEITRLELLGHIDPNDPKRNVVLFDESSERLYKAQSGLIGPQGGAALPNHFTPMTALPGERTLSDGTNQVQVKFESAPVGGVKLVKTYTLRRGDYVIGVTHEVVNQSNAPVDPQLYLQLVRDGNAPAGESSFYFTFTGPAIYTDASKFHKVDFKSIEKRQPGDKIDHDTSGDNGWIAMVQHYFASAWLLNGNEKREFRTTKVASNLYSVAMVVPLGTVAPGTTKTLEARLFAGPQEEDKLAKLAPGLELVKDYGYFKILAEPLFWLLTQLHKLIGNWGWAIVALVVLLKVAFYWLNASAYRSMAKMKAINPKVQELRERYKDKPQQMQQEMMRIYREEKVNPLGGCLPILVQMPFFIALYWVLLSTVEMRHAPWIGWITDLSAKDPFYILPLLMTASQLLQTWLNPAPPDPVQAKMMWIMPLVFSVMFFFFPAGLVLYWLTNNILSIAQQYVINKRLGVIGK